MERSSALNSRVKVECRRTVSNRLFSEDRLYNSYLLRMLVICLPYCVVCCITGPLMAGATVTADASGGAQTACGMWYSIVIIMQWFDLDLSIVRSKNRSTQKGLKSTK